MSVQLTSHPPPPGSAQDTRDGRGAPRRPQEKHVGGKEGSLLQGGCGCPRMKVPSDIRQPFFLKTLPARVVVLCTLWQAPVRLPGGSREIQAL
jgi:hypothetical protein